MNKILLAIIVIGFLAKRGFCQNTQELIGQVAKIYTGSNGSSSSLFGGITLWGMLNAIIFSSIGFVAFMYGKKNSEYRPMLIGIALMVYPYFLRGTLMLYLVGIGLTAALYFFRE